MFFAAFYQNILNILTSVICKVWFLGNIVNKTDSKNRAKPFKSEFTETQQTVNI